MLQIYLASNTLEFSAIQSSVWLPGVETTEVETHGNLQVWKIRQHFLNVKARQKAMRVEHCSSLWQNGSMEEFTVFFFTSVFL